MINNDNKVVRFPISLKLELERERSARRQAEKKVQELTKELNELKEKYDYICQQRKKLER